MVTAMRFRFPRYRVPLLDPALERINSVMEKMVVVS